MVGDVKQSIYKFRQARPELFMDKYEKFGENQANECGEKVEFQETIRLGKRVYEPADWPAFRQAVIDQQFFMNTPVILNR